MTSNGTYRQRTELWLMAVDNTQTPIQTPHLPLLPNFKPDSFYVSQPPGNTISPNSTSPTPTFTPQYKMSFKSSYLRDSHMLARSHAYAKLPTALNKVPADSMITRQTSSNKLDWYNAPTNPAYLDTCSMTMKPSSSSTWMTPLLLGNLKLYNG